MERSHYISRQFLQLMGFSSSTATQGEIGVLEAEHFPQRGTTGLWKGTRGKEREGGKEISFIIPHSPLVFLSSLNDTHYSSTKCCKCLQCDWCEGCLRGHIPVSLPHGAEHLLTKSQGQLQSLQLHLSFQTLKPGTATSLLLSFSLHMVL